MTDNELDLVKGVEMMHAVELIQMVAEGNVPHEATQAYVAVMAEFDEALELVYPYDTREDEVFYDAESYGGGL